MQDCTQKPEDQFVYGTPEKPGDFSLRVGIAPQHFKRCWRRDGRPKIEGVMGPSGRITRIVATPEFDQFMKAAAKIVRCKAGRVL